MWSAFAFASSAASFAAAFAFSLEELRTDVAIDFVRKREDLCDPAVEIESSG